MRCNILHVDRNGLLGYGLPTTLAPRTHPNNAKVRPIMSWPMGDPGVESYSRRCALLVAARFDSWVGLLARVGQSGNQEQSRTRFVNWKPGSTILRSRDHDRRRSESEAGRVRGNHRR